MLEDIINIMRKNNLKILVLDNSKKPVELLYGFTNQDKKIVLNKDLHIKLETISELSNISEAYKNNNDKVLITPPNKDNIIEINLI